MPQSAQDWLEASWSDPNRMFPIVREIDLADASVPDFVKSGLRTAEAATLNGFKILYAKGHIPTEESFTHELTHVAFSTLEREAPEVVAEAVDSAQAMGEALVNAAFKREWRTKSAPNDDSKYGAWWGARAVRMNAASVKRYIKSGHTDVTGALELNLMIPDYNIRNFAKHLGFNTEKMSDQWHEVMVYSGLSKRYKVTAASQYGREELVTYRAGTDREYAGRLFAALGKKKHA